MSTEDLLNDLAERLKERGTQSAIAAALGVGKSTVGRWVETREISEAHSKLLRLYLYGEVPFKGADTKQDLSSVLNFSPSEWRAVCAHANRVGLSPGQWIAEQVRTILAMRAGDILENENGNGKRKSS